MVINMGACHSSATSGTGSGSAGAGNVKTASNIDDNMLRELNGALATGTRSQLRSILDTLDDGTTFYLVNDDNGILISTLEVKKKGSDDFIIGDQPKDAVNAVRLIQNAPGKAKDTMPDTSSHVKVTGTKTETYDGMKFKTGTYDIAKRTAQKKNNKVEQTGKITNYDGVQYGVAKSGGEYFTTHIPTGLLLGAGQKNMKDVVNQIRTVHDRLIKGKDNSRAEKRFKDTIRGD